MNFLQRLDDWLIDRLFQPICDFLRRTFGWSKHVPAAVMLLLSVAGFLPIILKLLTTDGIFKVFGTLLIGFLLFNCWCIHKMVMQELSGYDEERPSLFIKELGSFDRKFRLVLIFSLIVFCLIRFWLVSWYSMVTILAVVAIVMETASEYFLACRDLPPGTRKTAPQAI